MNTSYCLDSIPKRCPPQDPVLSPPLTPALSHPFDKRQSTDLNYHSPNHYNTRPAYPMEYHHWMNPHGTLHQQQQQPPMYSMQQQQQLMAMPPRNNRPEKSPTTTTRKQPSKQNKHSCNYPDCQWSFKRFEHLKRHMLVHTGERPHVCPHPGCGKRFSRSDNFHAHYRTHEKKAFARQKQQQQQQQQQDSPFMIKEEKPPSHFIQPHPYYQPIEEEDDELKKPHACTDCDKRFRRLEHLKRHMRIHTHEQPFKCNFPGCLKAFSRSDNLTQHRKTHERRKQDNNTESFNNFDYKHPMMSWQGETTSAEC